MTDTDQQGCLYHGRGQAGDKCTCEPKPETQDSHNPPNEADCTCMGCRHFREQAIEDRIAALEAWRDSMPRSGRTICPGCNGRGLQQRTYSLLASPMEMTCRPCRGKGFVDV